MIAAAIAEAEADYDSIPEGTRAVHLSVSAGYEEDTPPQDFHPFTGQDAFACAAARRDHGSLQVLDSLRGSVDEEH